MVYTNSKTLWCDNVRNAFRKVLIETIKEVERAEIPFPAQPNLVLGWCKAILSQS